MSMFASKKDLMNKQDSTKNKLRKISKRESQKLINSRMRSKLQNLKINKKRKFYKPKEKDSNEF